MAGTKDYDAVPSNNNSATPNGAPEGMAAADVNNVEREIMANVKAGPYVVADLTALKALDSLKQATGNQISLTGLVTAGVGGGIFCYDSASSATADDLEVVEPTDSLGRWLRATGGFNSTFSPTLVGSTGGTATLSTSLGSFNVIEGLCYFSLRVIASSVAGLSGDVRIGNLPKSALAVTGRISGISFGSVNNFTAQDSGTLLGTFLSGTEVVLSDNSGVAIPTSSLTNTTHLDCVGSFQIA